MCMFVCQLSRKAVACQDGGRKRRAVKYKMPRPKVGYLPLLISGWVDKVNVRLEELVRIKFYLLASYKAGNSFNLSYL